MADITLSILTPEGKAFEGAVTGVVAPGSEGSFAVLRRHAPFISALQPGIVKVETDSETDFFIVERGFLEARDDTVAILVDRVEKALDEADAKAAWKRRQVEMAS